ncbi:MAG: peptide ABC transporter substrate-binding protein [Bacillaceae bacterium]
MKKKTSILLSSVLATSALLAGCGSDDKNEAGSQKEVKQVLNLVATAEIPSMDTAKATDAVSFEVMTNVMEGLYRLGKDDALEKGIAESHTVSEDGLTYTFKLRSDAKWSNGEPVTAKDFEYAWKRVVDPATASEYAYIMFDIKNAEDINNKKKPVDELGVKAIDDTTFEVTLAHAVPYFDKLVVFPVFYPQNEKYITEQGDKFALEANTTLYNGPFQMSEWKHEQSFKLEKNDNYWDKKEVKLEEINFNIVKDTAAAVNLFDSGKIHRTTISSEFVDKYKEDERFGTKADASIYFLRLNEKNNVLANEKARKAISMAFDKESVVDVVLNNGSTAANFFVPKNFLKGPDGKDFRDLNGDMNVYNKDEAQKLWEEAKKEIGVTDVTLEILNFDGEGSAKMLGEYLQEQLQQNLPGLTVKLKQQPFKQKLDLESKQEYDMSISGWGPDYPDPTTFLDMFVTDGGHNQMSYSNAKYDELVKSAKSEKDLAKRWANLQEAERLLIAEDAAIAPIYQRGLSFVQDKSVKDLYSHMFGGDYTYKWTYISK